MRDNLYVANEIDSSAAKEIRKLNETLNDRDTLREALEKIRAVTAPELTHVFHLTVQQVNRIATEVLSEVSGPSEEPEQEQPAHHEIEILVGPCLRFEVEELADALSVLLESDSHGSAVAVKFDVNPDS